MSSVQVNVRFPDALGKRVQALAASTARTPPQVVVACVEEFLPVLESGLYGSPVWADLKARWDADVAELVAALREAGKPSAQARSRRPRRTRAA